MSGGYEDGYKSCGCFWGKEPGKLVKLLISLVGDVHGLKILDAGCGEGKNAVFLGRGGAQVRAIDISELAIGNAHGAFPNAPNVFWEIADIRMSDLDREVYDVAVAYGLLHCMACEGEVRNTVEKIMSATKVGGYNLLCAFNDRHQELHAHPEFRPVLLKHSQFVKFYSGWEISYESDENLTEVHPHNGIVHTHSMTRLIMRKK